MNSSSLDLQNETNGKAWMFLKLIGMKL